MRIRKSQTNVIFEGKTYIRYQYENQTFAWTDIESNVNSNLNITIEKKLEEEYQKTLIPTKTLNPSEERGFDITRLSILIENILKDKSFIRNTSKEYKYGFEHALILVKGSINDILAYQANGEKPEVVNPVGQDDLRKTIEILLMYYSEANGGTTDNIQEYTDKFLRAIKPRETDKEEPKTREEQIQYINDVLKIGYDEIVSMVFNYVHKSVPH